MPTFTVTNDSEFSRPIHLTPEDERHLTRVLRPRVGESLRLTNGQGRLAQARIDSLQPLVITVLSVTNGAPALPITFLLPLIDQTRLEWAAEKLTELNIATIQLITTQRTQSHNLSPSKFARLKKAVATAQKQCGRTWPLILREPQPLASCLSLTAALKIVANPRGVAAASLASRLPHAAETLLLVGPEGGFDDNEAQTIAASGFAGLNLGATILRTETAAVALTAIMSS